MDTNSIQTEVAPTRAQYIQTHGTDSCIKQLKADMQERTARASWAALWTSSVQTYVERHVGEYLDDKVAESSTLFITDRNGHCVVTAGHNGVTTQFEVISRTVSDGSLDVVIDTETLKVALEAESAVADVLAELTLTGKVKVHIAGGPAITRAYARYMLEFQPVNVRDLPWLITR